MTDLSTWTPVEVDEALHEVHTRLAGPATNLEAAAQHHRRVEDALANPRTYYDASDLDRARKMLANCQKVYSAILAETEPYEAEFARRGGWTRAFLVLNTGGHVHKDRACSTCYFNTSYGWLPSLSGHAETEIVAAAGSDACTVCYPSAPVVKKARSIFHASEVDAQKARDERAAKKAEAAAKKAAKAITNPDGSPLEVFDYHVAERQVRTRGVITTQPARDRFETLVTLHAAKAWLTDTQETWSRGKRPEDIARVAAAIAHKNGTTPDVELAAAVKRAANRK